MATIDYFYYLITRFFCRQNVLLRDYERGALLEIVRYLGRRLSFFVCMVLCGFILCRHYTAISFFPWIPHLQRNIE